MPTPPTPPDPPPAPAVLLRDIEIPNLPSPYYHFEYDPTGRVTAASFASGLFIYDVAYESGRITEMRNNILVNHDKLQYTYDAFGRVSAIKYVDERGVVFTTLAFTYDGSQLIGLERSRRAAGEFVIDKTMSFSYYADGNLKELTEHRPKVDGFQEDATTIDRFELYDDKINVDGFSLIHDDFFDHVVLLPGVQLQKGNPGRQTHLGDGVNYRVDYGYTYDDNRRPLVKAGDLTMLNGNDEGKTFRTQSVFTYY